MRSIIYAFLSMLLVSCENETQPIPEANEVGEVMWQRGPTSAANSANPYDAAGQLHNDILEIYLPLETDTATVAEILARLDSIASADTQFTLLVSSNYLPPTATALNAIIDDPVTSTPAVIAATGMSTAAKNNIAAFLSDAIDLYELDTDFEEVYTFITDYETDVVASTAFTTAEKKVLLTNSAIARYGFWFSAHHKKRKPRDRDWDLLITTLTAGIEGTPVDTATSIMNSVAAAAVANQ